MIAYIALIVMIVLHEAVKDEDKSSVLMIYVGVMYYVMCFGLYSLAVSAKAWGP